MQFPNTRKCTRMLCSAGSDELYGIVQLNQPEKIAFGWFYYHQKLSEDFH
jgi:hypothetical protein